jgi:SNF2 family DNA or RNA helicase
MQKEIIANYITMQIDEIGIYFTNHISNDLFFTPQDIYKYNCIFFDALELACNFEECTLLEDKNKLFIPHDILYLTDEIGQNLINLNALKIKQISELELHISERRLINSSSFTLEYELKQKGFSFAGQVIGAFYCFGDTLYLIPSEYFNVIRLIKQHTDLNEKTSDDNWQTLSQLKDLCSNLSNVSYSRFIDNQEVIYYDGEISVDSFVDNEDNIHVQPRFVSLTEEENSELNAAIAQNNNIHTVYSSKSSTGKSRRVVISKKLHQTLQEIHDKPKLILEADKKLFLDNPNYVYKTGVGINLNNFSERVIGFGIIEEESKERTSSGLDWIFPFVLEFIDSNSNTKSKIITDEESCDQFVSHIIDHKEKNLDFFRVEQAICPFNNSNLLELSKVIPIKQEQDENITTEKDAFFVYDFNGNIVYVLVSFRRHIARDFSRLIRESKNTLDDAIYIIDPMFLLNEEQNCQIPLSTKNITLVFESIRTGLIVDSSEISSLEKQILDNKALPPEVILPKTLKIQLKDYQKVGVKWLQNAYLLNKEGFRFSGVLLADDMGLGKTLQVLTFLENLRLNNKIRTPSLVIAPVVLLNNWFREYHKFFNSNMKIGILHGSNIQKLKYSTAGSIESKNLYFDNNEIMVNLDTEKLTDFDLIITNYHTLVNYQASFSVVDWHVVVLDEAQAIKNPATITAKTTKALKSQFKIAITGTPVENSLIDLWSIFDFLNPTVLPPLRQYRSMFATRDVSAELIGKLKEYLNYDKPYTFLLRRLKLDVLSELPSKSYFNHLLPFNDPQYKEFNSLKANMTSEGVLAILGELNILHQSFELYQDRSFSNQNLVLEFANSSKGQKIIELLTDIQNKHEKVLIFAIYNSVQLLLKTLIESHFSTKVDIINGSVSIDKRDALIHNFDNDDKKFVLILSPRSAGVGLNLVMANHVIHYGRWWNPAIENQATDRVYRIGQEKNVNIHFLTLTTHTQNLALDLLMRHCTN